MCLANSAVEEDLRVLRKNRRTSTSAKDLPKETSDNSAPPSPSSQPSSAPPATAPAPAANRPRTRRATAAAAAAAAAAASEPEDIPPPPTTAPPMTTRSREEKAQGVVNNHTSTTSTTITASTAATVTTTANTTTTGRPQTLSRETGSKLSAAVNAAHAAAANAVTAAAGAKNESPALTASNNSGKYSSTVSTGSAAENSVQALRPPLEQVRRSHHSEVLQNLQNNKNPDVVYVTDGNNAHIKRSPEKIVHSNNHNNLAGNNYYFNSKVSSINCL
jgi:hypothetical protein